MKRHRGGPLVLSLIIAMVVFVPSTRAPAAVTSTTIKEVGTSFQPRQLDIEVANPTDEVDVLFSFVSSPSGSGHGVKFDDGTDLAKNCPALLFSDCQTQAGQTVSRRLSKGTYPYYCKIHGGPGGVGMAGVIVISVGAGSSTTTRPSTSPSSTTSSTSKATSSSTTATTRQLATSSTVLRSSTSTSDTSSALQPGAPPPFSNDDGNNAAGSSGGSKDGSDSRTVALIVALLLAVSAGGGYLLWRLRPGRT
ncbi:MAG TPA: hypothetical protein VKO35_10845 [Acidimicrobiia bacterium]|nr:hypothetical protein [Acidimicrobiia bacterium]